MNMKRGIGILSLLLLRLIPLFVVYGNVPSFLEVEATARGDDIVLGLEISHSSPSMRHYVDSVEVRWDDGEEVTFKQDPQSSTKFSVKIILEDTSPTKIEVRSHCISHGWSAWRVLELQDKELEENGGGIPGFPAESLFLGIALGLLLLYMTSKN
ncbi:hypothetical protein ACFL0D_04745 [Thermoproteota archaeon]